MTLILQSAGSENRCWKTNKRQGNLKLSENSGDYYFCSYMLSMLTHTASFAAYSEYSSWSVGSIQSRWGSFKNEFQG